MTTLQIRILAAMGGLTGPSAHRAVAADIIGHKPGEVYDALCELETVALVVSQKSAELDRFGRPKTSTWALTGES